MYSTHSIHQPRLLGGLSVAFVGHIDRRAHVNLRNLLRSATPEQLANRSLLKSESAMTNNSEDYASENSQYV
jgi:hypothetical protein